MNWSNWCYDRTCYGTVEIPSDEDHCITWTLKVDALRKENGYVCIGIDSQRETNTWFYGNRDAANYGYECTGMMYEFGDYVNTKQKYKVNDLITVQLNTTAQAVRFWKDKASGSAPQHSFKMATGPTGEMVYKLAVSLKNAAVSITDFEWTSASKQVPKCKMK